MTYVPQVIAILDNVVVFTTCRWLKDLTRYRKYGFCRESQIHRPIEAENGLVEFSASRTFSENLSSVFKIKPQTHEI